MNERSHDLSRELYIVANEVRTPGHELATSWRVFAGQD
jgi:hypothetical protein